MYKLKNRNNFFSLKTISFITNVHILKRNKIQFIINDDPPKKSKKLLHENDVKLFLKSDIVKQKIIKLKKS